MPLELRSFPNKIDDRLQLGGDERHDAYLQVIIPALKVAADELADRWSSVRQVVGGVDGMLLAAQTLDELADLLHQQILEED